MAMAEKPASATPCSVRSASSVWKSGLNAVNSASVPDATSDAVITGLRPQVSESDAARSIITASVAVVTDTDRLANAGGTPNSAVSAGSTGCVEYRQAKVTQPPRNSARLARQNAAEPCSR